VKAAALIHEHIKTEWLIVCILQGQVMRESTFFARYTLAHYQLRVVNGLK